MSFDRKMVALAAAVAELESSAELLAGVELLAAHAGRLGGKEGAAPVTTVPGVIGLKLGMALAEFRTAFWEVERLAVPEMTPTGGGAAGDSPSDQLTALLPLVQGISYPEVAMRIIEEVGTLAAYRMRGQWSPLWFEVRGRVLSALQDAPGRYEWKNGAFQPFTRDSYKRLDGRKLAHKDIGQDGGDAPIAAAKLSEYPATVATVTGEKHFREAPVVSLLDYGSRTEAIQDPLGCGVLVYSQGQVWRLVAQETTIMACVPGPEEFCQCPFTGSVLPWWVTSFDCRKSEGWLTYLAWFEKHWPGLYKGPREEDRVRNGN
jgi:hypothetical protein